VVFEFETRSEGLLLRSLLGGRIELAIWKHDGQAATNK
jgi:hypothetical protein